jgi:peptidoglycan/LPS O-acetylase OafA/YrhL
LDPSYGKMNFTPLTYSLFHGFSQRYNLYAIAQAWSLNVEMTFYFFAPLLCFLQRRHLLYLLGFMVLLLMAFLATGEIWYGLNHNPGQWLYPAKFVIGASFPGRCAEFLAGMLLAAALRNKRTEWIQKIPFKTWLGFLGIFITAYVIGQFQPDKFHHGADNILGRLIQNLVLPVFTVMALAGLIFERTLLQRFFSGKLMVLLGNASFAFYLVHISYVNLKIKSWFLLPDRNFVVLWIVSVMLYFLFEKPIYERGKKWIKKSGWVKP